MLILRLCLLALRLAPPVLIASILALVVIGTYAGDLFLLNPLLALIFGVVGYGMTAYGFSPAATVLGMVLGVLVESELRRSLIISHGSWAIFVTRPASAVLLVLTLGVLLYPAALHVARLVRARRGPLAAPAGSAPPERNP
jgi:putative tricarboxylic transport membrane protein